MVVSSSLVLQVFVVKKWETILLKAPDKLTIYHPQFFHQLFVFLVCKVNGRAARKLVFDIATGSDVTYISQEPEAVNHDPLPR
jgi:hypothetical protein